ncbi:MAG: hypothetical protein Q4C53_09340, partial [Clostridia bacterium]|nr:hypothetical protein [Clostridia bacterium]
TVTTNEGTVTANNGTVETNKGTVTANEGTVTGNAAGAKVEANNGTVETNEGRVEGNRGTVEENAENAVTVNEAGGTVEANLGTVVNNDGTVVLNGGTVELSGGTVEVNVMEGLVNITLPQGVADAEAFAAASVTDNLGTVTLTGTGALQTWFGVQVKDDENMTEYYHDGNRLGIAQGGSLGVLSKVFANARKGYELVGCKLSDDTAVDIHKAYTVNAPTLLWLQWVKAPTPQSTERRIRPADLDALTGEAAEALRMLFRGELGEGDAVAKEHSFVLEVGASQGKKVAVRFLVPTDRLPGVTLAHLQKLSLQRVLRMLEPWIPQAYFRTVSLPNGKTDAKLGKYVSVVTADRQGECYAFELVFNTGIVPA